MENEVNLDQLGASQTVIEQNIGQLKQLFPQVFHEEKINFTTLKELLGDKIEDQKEFYGLSWAGKSEARRELAKNTTATLTPDREKSVEFDTSQNIFIEGENLEVLRCLQKSYFGKIKMIYIDPPYNTGNDSFVYPDNYSETRQEYEKRTGITDEDGFINKVDLWKQNSKENGQYHSVWLSMMYSRLSYAHSLLSEDGVIFISIDDNEQANLKLLCDSVFGGENFLAQIIWERAFSLVNLKKHFSESHDYIICYSKQIGNLFCNGLIRSEEADGRYSNPDSDIRGDWTSGDFSVGPRVEKNVYEITTPSGKNVFPPSGRCWRVTKERFEEFVRDNRVWFGENGNNVPRVKRFLSEVKNGITPMTIWNYVDVGHSQDAKQKLKELFDGNAYFEYPKSVNLIKRCIGLYTNKKSNDIILDFFAGSGTTGHAVMELNKEDGGDRKYICVQMPEKTDEKSEAYKQGYEKISDICAERLRRAGKKIREEIEKEKKDNKEKLFDGKEINDVDTGFKYYRLTPSHFKVWQNDISQDNLSKQLDAFVDSKNEGSKEQDMLYELILKLGYDLTTPVETIKTGEEGEFYYLKKESCCIALNNFNKITIEEIRSLSPREVITLDEFFNNDDALLSNTRLGFKDKDIKLTII